MKDFVRMALVASLRSCAPEDVREQHQAFVTSGEFSSYLLDLDGMVEVETYEPRGRSRNLDELYDHLDRRFFRGSISRPRLHWWSTLSSRTFGVYIATAPDKFDEAKRG